MLEQLKSVELTRLNLEPGETLVVTIKDDDVGIGDVESVRTLFGKAFPNNRIIILAVSPEDDIKLTAVKSADSVSSCSTGSYCNDCSCGKKENFLNNSNQGE